MKFVKYNSIDNHYKEKKVNLFRNNLNPKTEFVALEKVHGANLTFLTDGFDVRVAKRTTLISNTDNFFGSNILRNKYENSIKNTFYKISSVYENVKQVQIQGEIFGGIYDFKTNPNFKVVQKEVQYTRGIGFLVFDILITFQDNEEMQVPWVEVKDFIQETELRTVPEIGTGTLDEMLDLPNDFLTEVPAMFGLQDIPGNITEGLVIKPLHTELEVRSERVILKSKNSKFVEKGKIKNSNLGTEIKPEYKTVLEEISRYFEPSRLDGLYSKGLVTKDDNIDKIAGLFLKDILAEVLETSLLDGLDKKERKLVMNLTMQEVRKYIRGLVNGY